MKNTNYIDDLSARYGSSDKFVIASKDGITVTFDLELNVEHEGFSGGLHYIAPEIEFNGSVVTESSVSITPNEDWTKSFTEEVKAELEQNENYKAAAEDFLSEWLEDENL